MDLWTYPSSEERDEPLAGFEVEAIDGSIGKVDEASYEAGESCLVVDTGFWIFGKKRVIPAGVIDRVDAEKRKVYINRTKDQVKAAPDWDESTWRSETSRQQLADYYKAP